MALLVARFEAVLRGAGELQPLDRFGRARFLETRGFHGEAIEEYRQLWRHRPKGTQPLMGGALGLRLARLLRRQGRWEEARLVLEECWRTQSYPYPVAIELAKLLEHQARDFTAARRIPRAAATPVVLGAVPHGP